MRHLCKPFSVVIKSFNPRICKRCDSGIFWTSTQYNVSIHASVKDATKCNRQRGFPFYVSIHASVKDATLSLYIVRKQWSFNPRICKRCDSILFNIPVRARGFNPRICKRCDIISPAIFNGPNVSIHASVKDATSANCTFPCFALFQSTHL